MDNREMLNFWRNKLLDTGKRNNLINFKNTKLGSVDVVYPNFDDFFSKVEAGKVFEVYDNENDLDEVEDYLADLVAMSTGNSDEIESLFSDCGVYEKEHTVTFKDNQILLFNSKGDPKLSLRNIARNGRSAIEETGVNIVYMAFGFLNWTEKDEPNNKMKAPILLVAVSIENSSPLKPYYIRVIDADFVVNPAMAYRIKTDYNVDIPPYEEGMSISTYLTTLEEMFISKGWKIDRDIKISTFSFLKVNMYKDLQDNEKRVLENQSIQILLSDPNALSSSSEKVIADVREGLDTIHLHNVVDADSSQNEAVAMAGAGHSFVLQGPPGTGKSQTITNIIAECLSQGKRVLFVSEKLAALQVVYDKLKGAGLDEFCLELHSHKSNKREVIEELNATLRKGKSVLRDDNVNHITAEFEGVKGDLDDYVSELHKNRPVINRSLYSIFEEIGAYRRIPTLDFVIDDIQEKGEDFFRDAEDLLARYCEYIPSIGYDYHSNCWYGYADTDGTYSARMAVRGELSDTISLIRGLFLIHTQLNEKYQIDSENLYQLYLLRDFFKLISKSNFITPELFRSRIYEVIDIVGELALIAKDRNRKKHLLIWSLMKRYMIMKAN